MSTHQKIAVATAAAGARLVWSATYALIYGPSEPIAGANPVLGIFHDLVGRSLNVACDPLPWR